MSYLRRSLNLFAEANLTSTATDEIDDDYPEDWEAPWGTKAAILLSQGIVVTILVALFIFACGRKHYRRMHSTTEQEFTIRIESRTNRSGRDFSAENMDVQDEEQRTRLQQMMHLITAPLRFVDSAVNQWASSPSTDFEYYDRILQRLEREKEAGKESAEDRAKRLMSTFANQQCVWEIDERHFISPYSIESMVSGSELNQVKGYSCAAMKEDVEIGTNAEVHKNNTVEEKRAREMSSLENNAFNAKTIEVEAASDEQISLEPEEQDLEVESDHIHTSTSKTHNIIESDFINDQNLTADENCERERFGPDSSLNIAAATENCSNQFHCNGQTSTKDPSPNPDNIHLFSKAPSLIMSTSFDSTSPGYLYLNTNVSQNRMRANSTGSSPTNIETLSLGPNFQKTISNQCAICLCDYTKGDKVVISSNNSCPHAFHQDCIIEWLVKMQDGTPCPCCRQTFVELDNVEHISNTERSSRRQMSEEELGALRRHLHLGFQRGRAFNVSVIRF